MKIFKNILNLALIIQEFNFLKANIKLSKLINKLKNFYIFNYEKIIKNYGIKNFYNPEEEK